MHRASASAPGKLILLGEHAVVYGMPALAIPVSEKRARAEVSVNNSGLVRIEALVTGDSWPPKEGVTSALKPLAEMTLAAARRLGRENLGVTVKLDSDIPIASGMGSSAAVAVALVRAIAGALNKTVKTREIVELAMVAERGYHGNPSGIDIEVVAREKPILHRKGTPFRALSNVDNDFHFLAANTGQRTMGTVDIVREVAEAYDKDRERYGRIFNELGDMAECGAKVLERGTVEELGELMNNSQELLAEIDLSSPAIDRLICAAIESGAVGAKLSGAGRGGHVIIALRSADEEPKAREALIKAGAKEVCGLTLRKTTSECMS